MKIHLGTVNITEKTKKLMQEALDTETVSQGHFTKDFENEIKKRFNVKHALVTSSGTMADAVALAALKYLNPGKDEVIIPALTFIAHVNALYYNHLKPVFVDVGKDFQIDTSKIQSKITDRTLAIMPVNLLGSFCDIESVLKIAKENNLKVLTDDCEAFGSRYKGKAAGTLADAGTFSFFASHTICCAEGGMVVTNDDKIADLAIAIRNHGRKSNKVEDKFVFPWIGFNAKMNCLEAIIGLGVIDELEEYIEKRRRNYAFLRDNLGVNLLPDKKDIFVTHHCFPILFKDKETRDKNLQEIFNASIECRKLYSCIPTEEDSYKHLGHNKGEFPIAEDLSSRGLFLPIHQDLTQEDLEYIVKIVKPLL